MASYALLIGTKDGKREVIKDGDPREIRKTFKHSDGEGFELLEVVDTSAGRTRSRRFNKKSFVTKKQATKKPSSK